MSDFDNSESKNDEIISRLREIEREIIIRKRLNVLRIILLLTLLILFTFTFINFNSRYSNILLNIPITVIVTLLTADLLIDFLNKISRNNKISIKLSRYPKLSIVGIFRNKLEDKKINSYYFVLTATLIYSIVAIFSKNLESNIYFILGCLIYASLLYLNTFLVNFRIKKGFYGGNEFEAREIIHFIEENSENIDFSDGNTPKKLFNEEDLKEIEEEIMIEFNNGLPQPNI